MKHQLCEFKVQVADTDGEPCIGNQDVTVQLVSVQDEVITHANIVSKTSAMYVVSFEPHKSGQHKINVTVNGKAIKGSPFSLFVTNIPHPQNCKALGNGIKQAEKHKESKFIVDVADADNEPCVTKQIITASLKSLTGSVINAVVVSKTTATYEVSYQPNKAGQHEFHVAINDMPINGSPFALLVHNIPDPFNNCKAVGNGVKEAEKGINTMFIVQLADADGEPCVTEQKVMALLKFLADGSVTNARVVKMTAATYEATYQPTKGGEHELIVKVNSTSIKGSPFKMFVCNSPHPQNCKAVGEGIQQAEKNKKSKCIVQLADVDGEPCITKQEVTVVLKCLADDSVVNVDVVSRTAAIYEASYLPSKSREHQLFVNVNGKPITGSPFPLLVSNIPHPQNCKAVGEGIQQAEKYKTSKFIIQLADVDGEPCITKQEVTVVLKCLADDSFTKLDVLNKTAATYEAIYQPSKSGEHQLLVEVNGKHISDSPFSLLVTNIPHPQNCKALGDGLKQAEKNVDSKFMVELADADDEPCVTKQVITAMLKSLAGSSIQASVVSKTTATYEVSYRPNKAGQHEFHVAVNDMPINGSPFALLVHNIPNPFNNCKAVGNGVKEAEKGINTMFIVQLADADGEPCVTEQKVTVALKSMADSSVTNARVVKMTAATYEATYQPTKGGEHELIVKVNSTSIKGSPFKMFVCNSPHPQNCKAVGEGIQQAEKNKKSKCIVQLADVDGEPCITKQEVIIVLNCLADDSVAKVDVVSRTAAIYEASYQPSKIGDHQLLVKVNGKSIKGSPFPLFVYNIPHPQNCKAVGDGIKSAEKNRKTKFIVQLADVDGEPCVTEQQVTVQIKCLADHSITEACIVKKTVDTYEAAYQPNKSGQHEIIVKVNGTPITSSPFSLCVNNFLALQMQSMSEHISYGPPAIYRLCAHGQDVMRDSRACNPCSDSDFENAVMCISTQFNNDPGCCDLQKVEKYAAIPGEYSPISPHLRRYFETRQESSDSRHSICHYDAKHHETSEVPNDILKQPKYSPAHAHRTIQQDFSKKQKDVEPDGAKMIQVTGFTTASQQRNLLQYQQTIRKLREAAVAFITSAHRRALCLSFRLHVPHDFVHMTSELHLTNPLNRRGDNVLHIAVKLSRSTGIQILQYLLQHNGIDALIVESNSEGINPLVLALKLCNLKVSAYLSEELIRSYGWSVAKKHISGVPIILLSTVKSKCEKRLSNGTMFELDHVKIYERFYHKEANDFQTTLYVPHIQDIPGSKHPELQFSPHVLENRIGSLRPNKPNSGDDKLKLLGPKHKTCSDSGSDSDSDSGSDSVALIVASLPF